MVVGFTICNQYLSPLKLWVRTPFMARCTRYNIMWCHWLATCRWFSPGSLVSSTNKTDRHNITEILLKVALNTINLNPDLQYYTTSSTKGIIIKFVYWGKPCRALWKDNLNWWLTINKANNHLSPQLTEHKIKTTTYVQVVDWDRQTIGIVTAKRSNYVTYLYNTLYSLLQNAAKEYKKIFI